MQTCVVEKRAGIEVREVTQSLSGAKSGGREDGKGEGNFAQCPPPPPSEKRAKVHQRTLLISSLFFARSIPSIFLLPSSSRRRPTHPPTDHEEERGGEPFERALAKKEWLSIIPFFCDRRQVKAAEGTHRKND